MEAHNDSDTRDTTMMGAPATWAIAGAALVLGLLGGLGIAAFVGDDGSEQGATDRSVPTACLEAIEEARTELAARREVLSIPDQVRSLVERSAAAMAELDTARLEELLSEIERLARSAQAAAEELSTDEFERPAQECEELVATPTPG